MVSVKRFNRVFWEGVGDRAARTAAQFATFNLALQVGPEALESGFNGLTVDFIAMAGWALGGALLSLLTSIAVPAKVGEQPGEGADVD